MLVTVTEEVEVKASANEVWNFYKSLLMPKLILELFPDFAEKYEVQGDGGVGTVLHFTFRPSGYLKEKFTVVDNEKRIKVAELIEGGHLEKGLDRYRVRFEVINKQKQGEKGAYFCITKGSIEYETQDSEAAKNALESIQLIQTIMKAVTDRITCKTSK